MWKQQPSGWSVISFGKERQASFALFSAADKYKLLVGGKDEKWN